MCAGAWVRARMRREGDGGGLGGVDSGEMLLLGLWRGRASFCLAVGAVGLCGLGFVFGVRSGQLLIVLGSLPGHLRVQGGAAGSGGSGGRFLTRGEYFGYGGIGGRFSALRGKGFGHRSFVGMLKLWKTQRARRGDCGKVGKNGLKGVTLSLSFFPLIPPISIPYLVPQRIRIRTHALTSVCFARRRAHAQARARAFVENSAGFVKFFLKKTKYCAFCIYNAIITGA